MRATNERKRKRERFIVCVIESLKQKQFYLSIKKNRAWFICRIAWDRLNGIVKRSGIEFYFDMWKNRKTTYHSSRRQSFFPSFFLSFFLALVFFLSMFAGVSLGREKKNEEEKKEWKKKKRPKDREEKEEKKMSPASLVISDDLHTENLQWQAPSTTTTTAAVAGAVVVPYMSSSPSCSSSSSSRTPHYFSHSSHLTQTETIEPCWSKNTVFQFPWLSMNIA